MEVQYSSGEKLETEPMCGCMTAGSQVGKRLKVVHHVWLIFNQHFFLTRQKIKEEKKTKRGEAAKINVVVHFSWNLIFHGAPLPVTPTFSLYTWVHVCYHSETQWWTYPLLSEPTFISASWVKRKEDPDNDKIYIFFREKNSDQNPEVDPWISRVSRVCKVCWIKDADASEALLLDSFN